MASSRLNNNGSCPTSSEALNVLACPACKASLVLRISEQTASGVVKLGALYCEQCRKHVGAIRHGKADFIRVELQVPSGGLAVCDEFHYKRIPWSDCSVSADNCSHADLGWSSEGCVGCLQAGVDQDWSICITTDATDLSLRFLSHGWSGGVSVAVNDKIALAIDLFSSDGSDVKPYEVFRNLKGSKKVKIRPVAANPLSKGRQVYFFGMDAIFSGELPFAGGNRGNGFPQAYKWILDNLGPDALVLDCGAGDRKYPDSRVVSFEYMPFELL